MKNNRKNRCLTYIRVKTMILKNPGVSRSTVFPKMATLRNISIDDYIHKMWLSAFLNINWEGSKNK